ncbi:ArnT family glycosyltransferase [Xanthomonas theicola]|uniref:Glycosyltransferase RgtA/B/C/D-like domain-containing protein n=1 Tax=Xanthomonas theicola TaxID=56464 RepID=A0A2S6ZI68_9XANT|nr:glycosyltransferase family 39 protein [Xanthomonas theicola]PPT91973.1 hypothetical protein XthCFBP4691_05855 [Xanthomonas theicola]QNH24960.1 glycosyltransferase family 39 protein [Xanthomonas theicola]
MTPKLPARILGIPSSPLLALGLCTLLAFAFLGLRGIWEPDEGRYTNVALTMLDTGDWISPKRSEEVGHWTKPPLTYWLVASSVEAFGHTPWAARLPIALSFLACMILAGACARRIHPGTGPLAAIVYGTMIVPFVAGQLVTTDFLLAALQALAVYAYLERRFGGQAHRHGWLLLMWAALGLGFVTKGPPALVPLLVFALMARLSPGPRIRWHWHALGVGLFLAIALPWYIVVSLRNPGLLQYFLGAELVDRVASDRFGRNGEWYGWLKVYAPTLILGTLPWSMELWRWLRRVVLRTAAWQKANVHAMDPRQLLLALWILVPIAVFCLARSRLPLYLLPIFVPLAVAVAGQRAYLGRGLPRWQWLALWIALLLASRVAGALWPTHKDSSVWADAIRERVRGPIREVVFVEDMARYGLHLHLGAEIEKVSRRPQKQARFNPEYDGPLMQEVQEVGREPGLIFVTKQAMYPAIAQSIAAYGYTAHAWGTPFQQRIIFGVQPPAPLPERSGNTAIGHYPASPASSARTGSSRPSP